MYDWSGLKDHSMTILTTPGKRRSNRALTAQAINATIEYLNGERRTKWDFGNTQAFIDENLDFNITLFSKPILKLVKKGYVVDQIQIFAGGAYDADGNPTNLTRERLNGLLDALGSEGLIPENVRVWMDKESGVCYLVHFEDKQILNKHYCKMISLSSSPKEFNIKYRDIVTPHSC